MTSSYPRDREAIIQLLSEALATELVRMLKANLIAERVAIESYREMIAYVGERDPTTHRMLKEILAKEEEHAEDIADLLDDGKNR